MSYEKKISDLLYDANGRFVDLVFAGKAADAEIARLQAQVDALAVALRADAAAIEDGIRHDEYCDRANAEGWDNDPTGSSHISSSASRLRALQERAAAMKRAALAAVGR